MDHVWVGRRLMQAAPALVQRYTADTDQCGSAGMVVGPIASDLIRQVGLLLYMGDTDYRRPFARTGGVLRFNRRLKPTDLAQAFNALMALVAHYLENLPGVSSEAQWLARQALRHAASESLELLQS